MTKRQRVVTYVAASVGVLVLGWTLLIGGIYLLGGVATVSVVERDAGGVRMHLPVPMALIHAAAATTDIFFTDQILNEIDIETGGRFSEIAPHVIEMLDALDDVPNGTTFVEVHDGDEHVKVSKERGKFKVEVESPDLSVNVSVPTRAVKRTVRTILN